MALWWPSGLAALLLIFVVCLTGLSQAFNMTLVHSHDTYGSVVAVTKLNAACTPFSNGTYPPKCYGGVGRRMTFIDNVRATTTNVLLIDTGNILTESPLEAAGGALALGQFYNSLGYSVLKLGDHDLANPSKLADFLSAVPNATIVASNLINTLNDTNLSSYSINSYAITTFPGGERVGVCGGVGQNVRVKITASTPLNSTDEVQALKAAVGRLTNLGVNKIVAAIYDEALISTVLAEVIGIDVLIVHSELYLNDRSISVGEDIDGYYPAVYQVPWGQPVLVVGSGSYGKYLGKLNLVFDQYGVITGWSGDSYLLTSSYAEAASLKSAVVNYYSTVVNASYTTQVGFASADIGFQSSCNFSECTVGSWQADKLRALTNSDIGFINSGSIGGGWSQGPIMAVDVQRVVKYGMDFIYTLSVSGAELLVALENSVSQINTGRFLQISGLKFSWNANEQVGWRVVDVWLVDSSGRTVRVDNSTHYSVVVLDFVAKGGDGYSIFANNGTDVANTGYTLYQVVLQALAAENVAPVSGGRIVASSATRRSCLASDGTICSNSGVCAQGVCQCYKAGSGPHCEPQTTSGSSDDHTTAIVLGTVLPFMFLVLLLGLLMAFIAWMYMRRKQARLNLKEPNYQVLVWRREGEKKVAMPKTVNSKITDVLEKFLMNETVVKALSGVIHTNRAYIDEVSAALVLIHQSANKGTQLIKTLLKHELLSEDEKVLFREETLGVKAFSVFSRMVGLPYLWCLFAYPIAEFEIANNASDELSPRNSKSNLTESDPTPLSIFSMHNTIEINPKHLEEGQDDSLGRLQLEIIVQKLLTRIINSLPHFPLYLRQLCHMLYEDMRYDHPDYIHRVLGNLIFLRFICPALLAPQNCGLSKEHTHPKTHRTLILIAKVLQNLANKNDFTGKEHFMEALNDFIHRNIAKVEGFFDGLCAPVAEPQFGDPPTSIVPRQFRKKALLVMYQFVQSHNKELHDELQEFPSYEVKDALDQLAYLTQEVNAQMGGTAGDYGENEEEEEEGDSTSDRDEMETADEVPTS